MNINNKALNSVQKNKLYVIFSTMPETLKTLSDIAYKRVQLDANTVKTHTQADSTMPINEKAMNLLEQYATVNAETVARYLARFENRQNTLRLLTTNATDIADRADLHAYKQYSRLNIAYERLLYPQHRSLVGYCVQCDNALYENDNANITVCPRCSKVNKIEETRNRMTRRREQELHDYKITGTAAHITRVFNEITGRNLRANTLRKWIARGKINPTRNEDDTITIPAKTLLNLTD